MQIKLLQRYTSIIIKINIKSHLLKGVTIKSDDDYDTRLSVYSKLNLLSLFKRRFVGDIIFLFNIINSDYDIDISNKLMFRKYRNTSYNLRKNDTQDIAPNFSLTNGFNSFLYHIVIEWNSLPNRRRKSNSIAAFNKKV